MQFDFKNEVAKKSDADLIACYKNAEQYQESYIAEVEEELKRRGIEYGNYKIENERRKQMLDELVEKGEPGNRTFITIGFISAFLGGFIGIVAGWVYSRSKRTSLSGNRYYAYVQKQETTELQ
jgi:hypothetical protein